MSGNHQEDQNDIARKFTSEIEAVFGGDLGAVILYGSAVRGGYRRGFSDINILIILERNDTRKIFEAGKRTAALGRKHGITPLIMT
ncbi:MAG: nucleotidyltransferase domain-containing protein, partial [Spirochaetaceae bacterium]|nr:nucleotidyltransferase domain-containing protein [Spirochaetaceae bacterium]